ISMFFIPSPLASPSFYLILRFLLIFILYFLSLRLSVIILFLILVIYVHTFSYSPFTFTFLVLHIVIHLLFASSRCSFSFVPFALFFTYSSVFCCFLHFS